MNVPLRRTAYSILSAFVLLLASVVYIQVIEGPDLRDDTRNQRVVAWRTGRQRGPIVSSDGVTLANSTPSTTDPKLYEREYTQGDLYSHIVGFTSVLYGSRGVELSRSDALTSDRDTTISGVLTGLLGGDTKPRGVRLTINHDLQLMAAEALGDQRGSVIALDPRTGAILAMVSYPRFDPNNLIGSGSGPTGQLLENDDEEPLLNRAIDQTYSPGSIIEVITTASGLDTGLIGASTVFNDPVSLALLGTDSVIHNYDNETCGNGTSVELEFAFINSCNTVFAQLGMDLGGDQLGSTASSFGFNTVIPFEFDVLTSSFPLPGTLKGDRTATAQSAIGQNDVRTTPLLMALTVAAVSNRGNIMSPYLVDEIYTSEGTIEYREEPTIWKNAMSPASASVLTDMMEQVIISEIGHQAAVPGVRIAGKTGTAEVPEEAPHAWFIGFGPVSASPDTPQIAIAVIVESGGVHGESATGGSVAAPIAQQLFAAFFDV